MVPKLVAHRGWASRWPENTLEGLMAAVDAGAEYVEFDIQLSVDGMPIVLHDATLERTAGRAGCALDMRWDELKNIKVGETGRLGEVCPHARLPSLSLIRDWLATEPEINAFAEIKTESLSRFGVGRVLEACLQVLEPVLDRCVMTSFSDEVLLAARQQRETSIAWVLERYDEQSLIRATSLAPEYLFCNYRKLPGSLDMLPAGPWQWVLYEVSDAQLALDLAKKGAGFVESMAVGELLSDPLLDSGSETF
jgi:glycerophosphoryl diester phosphodiesterase